MSAAPLIPVSWGELLDKISILEIKVARIMAPAARANVQRELAALLAVVQSGGVELAEQRAGLLAVNTRLWRIEDAIREKEAAGDFGPEFVRLARLVYHENDERGRIKRAINDAMGSAVVEEKQYASYGHAP